MLISVAYDDGYLDNSLGLQYIVKSCLSKSECGDNKATVKRKCFFPLHLTDVPQVFAE